ncbi:MAG: hypothetical protein MJE77_33350 [Proteobacteria bacterium]|nr:hypothetical protein [Pseudomonadota bacterium]
MIQLELKLEPIRGRPMEVTAHDGVVERGMLIDAVRQGLELCRHQDGKRIVVEWEQVERAEFLDEPKAGQ